MSITVMNPGGGTVDPKMRSEAGRMLARYCGVEDLWTDAGPAALLREMAEAGQAHSAMAFASHARACVTRAWLRAQIRFGRFH